MAEVGGSGSELVTRDVSFTACPCHLEQARPQAAIVSQGVV